MDTRHFSISRRKLMLGTGTLALAFVMPKVLMAADPIKMAGIYTVPVEQQWVSRVHIAAEAAKAAGQVDYTFTGMPPTPTIRVSCVNIAKPA